MRTPKSSRHAVERRVGLGLAAIGAALAGAAALNVVQAKRAEAKHPPLGDFLTVDGVRLHYIQRGVGAPLVLLHGNATLAEDWLISGALDELAKHYRVIAFDRPGYGYSDRPRLRVWSPRQQAHLLATAFEVLGIKAPVVVGHSLGTQVALALALDHKDAVGRLVLLGGYYFGSLRADAGLALPMALPVVGDLLSNTIAPLWGAVSTPAASVQLFAPAAVPQRWKDAFPFGLMLRPKQICAGAADGAMMAPTALELAKRYDELSMRVLIIAGGGDRISDPVKQSQRLSEMLPQSRLILLEGAGHMVHHTDLRSVVDAIIE